ncbi:YqaJ viral recombinase family protein [Pseudomonas luteola]
MILEQKDRDALLEMLHQTLPHVPANIASDWLDGSADVISKDIESGEMESKGNDYESLVNSLKWHIRRKKTFGASDMSCLYMEFIGQWYPFGEAADVIRDKLCLRPVQPMTGDTSRGVIMEDLIRKKFIKHMEKQGVFLEPDTYAKQQISALRFAGGIPGTPWMDCSPDDIFLDQDGQRYLLDYKCPAEQSSIDQMMSKIPDYYVAQLGQEEIILQHLGIPADRTLLVPFSMKTMQVYPIECSISEDVYETIVNAGNFYWNCVLNREFPRRLPSKEYQFVNEMPEELSRAVLEFAFHNKAKLLHDSEEERAKERLAEIMTLHRIDINNPDIKTILPMVDIRHQTTKRFNQSAAIAKLKELGVDTEGAEFWNQSQSRIIQVNRSGKNRYAETRDKIEDFTAARVGLMRTEAISSFLSHFKSRDSVVIEDQTSKRAKKVTAPKADEPSF